MSDAINGKPPVSFWIIGGVALVWNLIGVMIFYMQVSASPDDLAQYYNETELEFLTSIPSWATAANAVAVIAGALGCLLLLMRKIWAVPAFIISLLGIVVQDIHAFVIADGIAVWGPAAAVLPLVVIVIAVALVLYSRAARENHWID